MRNMISTSASETSLDSRRKTVPTASRDAGLAGDMLQTSVITGAPGGADPRIATAGNTNQEKVEPVPRFLIVKRIDDTNFDRISPFLISRILYGLVGNLKNIRKTKEGLLVETVSAQQAMKLLKLEKMGEFNVSVSPHRTLNFSKGVVYCADFLNCSIEEILDELQSEGVTAVKRIKTKRNGNLVDTANHILTFNRPVLPGSIKAAFYNSKVRPYIPSPLRCFNCQRFGHTNMKCTNEAICICGKPPHIGEPCSDPMLCVNCGGQHSARYRECPRMKEETAIQNVKTLEKLSYQEARKKVLSHILPGPASYAQTVATSNVSHIQNVIKDLMPNIAQVVADKMKECLNILTDKLSGTMMPPKMNSTEKRKKRASSDDELDSEFSGVISDSTNSSQPRKRGRPKGTTRKTTPQIHVPS